MASFQSGFALWLGFALQKTAVGLPLSDAGSTQSALNPPAKEFITTQHVFYENSAVCQQKKKKAVRLRDVNLQWRKVWFLHIEANV